MDSRVFFKGIYRGIAILILLILLGNIPYVTKPILNVIFIIGIPILLGGFLYYLLRPLLRVINKILKNKTLAIIISFLIVILMLSVLFFFGGSIIYQEIRKLIIYFTKNIETTKIINDIANTDKLDFLKDFGIQEKIIQFSQNAISKISRYNYIGAFSSITNTFVMVILIPFILFYFLKDDEKIKESFLKFFSESKKEEINMILEQIDNELALYINGQVLVAFVLGILMFIGYIVIGLPNALGLSIIAMVSSLIPVVGTTMGFIPALFISLSVSISTVIKLFIVLIIAQQLEGNLVRPFIQGDKLKIHPLIVVFVIIASILLFGVLGAIYAVPVYVVFRVIARNKIEVFKKDD
ncbi:MAG: AI-2E family transporter [Fusobacteriota bacterium]